MDNTQDDLKAHLMATDDEFRRAAEEHAQLKRQIEEIEARGHVTPEDEMEEHRLKKLKLAAKDRMTEIMERHRMQHA